MQSKNARGQAGTLKNLITTTSMVHPNVKAAATPAPTRAGSLALLQRFTGNDRQAVRRAFEVALICDRTTLAEVAAIAPYPLAPGALKAAIAAHPEEAAAVLAYLVSRRLEDNARRAGITLDPHAPGLIAKWNEDIAFSYAIDRAERRGDWVSADRMRDERGTWQAMPLAEQNIRLVMCALYWNQKEIHPGDLSRKLFVTPFPGAYGHAGYVITIEGSPPKGTFFVQGGNAQGTGYDQSVTFTGVQLKPKTFKDPGPYPRTRGEVRDRDVRKVVQAFLVERFAPESV